MSIKLDFIFLTNTCNVTWKQKAKNEMQSSELVIVYDINACSNSQNSKWEIDFAKRIEKRIFEIVDYDKDFLKVKQEIEYVYHFQEEFENCFMDESNIFELYKLMIDSSEKLIQRRQSTNTFFITIIGLLLSIAGFLFQSQGADNNTPSILYGFSVIGILLCVAWHNLIDNYGKLNRAKFDVILRLEQRLGSRIYSAEWIALGKGLRPQKYKSFTLTEKRIPIYFSVLIITLTIVLTLFYNPKLICNFWSYVRTLAL